MPTTSKPPVEIRSLRDRSKARRGKRAKKGKRKTDNVEQSAEVNKTGEHLQNVGEEEVKEKKNRYRPLLSSTHTLTHIIRGHSRNADSGAIETDINVWACDFQPPSSNASAVPSPALLATCGGNTVCFVDAAQGRVVRKYTHLEIGEEFYCLAWTSVTGADMGFAGQDDGVDKSNEKDKPDEDRMDTDKPADDQDEQECFVLAVAGHFGSIKLLNPAQNECYRYLFGHTKPVTRLTFSKTRRRWLFSASWDQTVRLWDIGMLNTRGGQDGAGSLAVFSHQSLSPPSALCLPADDIYLLVGFQDGAMARFNLDKVTVIDPSALGQANEGVKVAKRGRPKKAGKGAEGQHLEALRPSIVYPVGQEWHESAVDDVAVLGDGFVVSRAAQDGETIVWDPRTSTPTDADIRCALDWPWCEANLRFRVVDIDGERVLVTGDYHGNIRIYDVGETRRSQTLPDQSKEKFEADKILGHPQSDAAMNDVCVSNDGAFIAAVDSENRIFVWQREG